MLAAFWESVLGKPRANQTGRAGELAPDLFSGRKIRRQFLREEARPWSSERRNGLARSMDNRQAADGGSSDCAALHGVQFCLNTMLSRGGSPAYRTLCGSSPADLFMRQDGDSRQDFVQDTFTSARFGRQLKVRELAQAAPTKKVAISKLRRPLARHKTFGRADVQADDSVTLYKLIRRESAPGRRGPAAVKFEGQTFKVGRYYVMGRQDPKGVANVERDPSASVGGGEIAWPPPVGKAGPHRASVVVWRTTGARLRSTPDGPTAEPLLSVGPVAILGSSPRLEVHWIE